MSAPFRAAMSSNRALYRMLLRSASGLDAHASVVPRANSAAFAAWCARLLPGSPFSPEHLALARSGASWHALVRTGARCERASAHGARESGTVDSEGLALLLAINELEHQCACGRAFLNAALDACAREARDGSSSGLDHAAIESAHASLIAMADGREPHHPAAELACEIDKLVVRALTTAEARSKAPHTSGDAPDHNFDVSAMGWAEVCLRS